jgi:hypothetical protein
MIPTIYWYNFNIKCYYIIISLLFTTIPAYTILLQTHYHIIFTLLLLHSSHYTLSLNLPVACRLEALRPVGPASAYILVPSLRGGALKQPEQ